MRSYPQLLFSRAMRITSSVIHPSDGRIQACREPSKLLSNQLAEPGQDGVWLSAEATGYNGHAQNLVQYPSGELPRVTITMKPGIGTKFSKRPRPGQR